MPISPPGDVRPAFPHDLEVIRRAVDRGFGDPGFVPDDRVVVLNASTSYEDRLDEVIFDGQVMGAVRYEFDRWVFMPRLEGARRLNPARGWVRIDGGAVGPVSRNANVLAPGVVDADPNICVDDEVIVLSPDDRVVMVGRARMTGQEMIKEDYGLAVRKRWNGIDDPVVLPGGQTWRDVVRANLPELRDRVREAQGFIRDTIREQGRPVVVSYSGGKDSLATLYLVNEAIDDFDMVYVDTGLEFPETTENVYHVAREMDVQLKSRSAGEAFWVYLPEFGPPSRESRWCCKVAKLGPITRLIEEEYEECLTFIGQRRYESSLRSKSSRVWRNPWVANQVSASPIQEWTALHVWLYIFWKDLPYNPLYERGYERIGCYLCPSADLADLHNVRETHPRLWSWWEDYLESYVEEHELDRDWINLGLWRWQKLPSRMREIAEEKGIRVQVRPREDEDLGFEMVSGYRPCSTGDLSAEASFGRALNLARVEDSGLLRMLGRVRGTDGLLAVSTSEASVQVYASGTMTIRAPTEEKVEEAAKKVRDAIVRAHGCRGCGVCVAQCPVDAISVEEHVLVDDACTGCGRCNNQCPVLRF